MLFETTIPYRGVGQMDISILDNPFWIPDTLDSAISYVKRLEARFSGFGSSPLDGSPTLVNGWFESKYLANDAINALPTFLRKSREKMVFAVGHGLWKDPSHYGETHYGIDIELDNDCEPLEIRLCTPEGMIITIKPQPVDSGSDPC